MVYVMDKHDATHFEFWPIGLDVIVAGGVGVVSINENEIMGFVDKPVGSQE
jgi:hypothetical protein